MVVFYLLPDLLFCLRFFDLLKNYLVIITDYPLCFPSLFLPSQNCSSLESDSRASLENTEAVVFLEKLVLIFDSRNQPMDFF